MVMGALERLRPPRSLGDVTLMARLGEGGMATVYLGVMGEGPLARLTAVKLLRGDLPDHDYRTRFLDEAKVVCKLHHNNLVDVRAAGEHDGQLFIAMEPVEGRDLADVWDRCADVGRAFPVEIAVHVVREVLRGLHYAHTFPGLSLVHRDVSPSNVLIDWSGAVRLADFGLATSTLKAANTVPGVVFGKVGYMSPEQALREPLDGRADVYACGAILWELVTGRPLRPHDQLDTDTVARFEARPPSTLSKRVDPDLDQIVMLALARDKERRFSTAKAMLDRLSAWLAARAPRTSQESLAEFMSQLFGDDRVQDRGTREALLRELSRELQARAAAAPARRVDTDPLDPAPEVAPATAGDAELSPRKPPTLDELEHIPAGAVIADRYRVLSRLGRGGMGTVYLGEHLTVGRSVAIKVLTHEWSRHEGVAARFRAEARAASAAGHPNIVEVFDAGELPDGRLFLVMEFLTGNNLFEEIQATGPMEVARACRIIRAVARAVRAAHEVGIIHRDLKPDNVMLGSRRDESDGEFVKVLDFGISASVSGEPAQRLTQAGQALGTPEYMAPEQALGREATEQFDIYALGVIFFEMLHGRPPITDGNAIEIMSRKTVEPSPPLASVRADLPRRLCELVDDCLQIDPAKRPASARVFLARVEDVLRALPRTGDHPTPRKTEVAHVRARQGSALVWAVGGVTAAILVGVGLWLASADGEPPRAGPAPGAPVPAAPSAPAPTLAAAEPAPPAPSPGPLEAPPEARAGPERSAPAEKGPRFEKAGPEHATPERTAQAGDPSPTPEGPDGPACRRARAQAADARTAGDWDGVLRHTRDARCWPSSPERTALRVKALSEQGRWEDCIAAGRGTTDEKVARVVKICRARAAQAAGSG
jgi:serine/threonine-protein kinase